MKYTTVNEAEIQFNKTVLRKDVDTRMELIESIGQRIEVLDRYCKDHNYDRDYGKNN